MSNNETTARVITIRLRVPALIVAAVLLVGGLIWSFVLGIMVGRGQINEELARMMPESRQEANAQDETDKALAEIEDLIKAEDLKFQESLRQNQQEGISAPAPVGSGTAAGTATQSPSRPQRPDAAEAAALAEAARRDSGQSASAPAVQAPTGGQQYQYLYQVASFNKEEQAKDMQGRLQAKGFESRIETTSVNGQPRFRVLISFRGNSETVTQMQNLLKKDFKINDILQRGRTPLAG